MLGRQGAGKARVHLPESLRRYGRDLARRAGARSAGQPARQRRNSGECAGVKTAEQARRAEAGDLLPLDLGACGRGEAEVGRGRRAERQRREADAVNRRRRAAREYLDPQRDVLLRVDRDQDLADERLAAARLHRQLVGSSSGNVDAARDGDRRRRADCGQHLPGHRRRIRDLRARASRGGHAGLARRQPVPGRIFGARQVQLHGGLSLAVPEPHRPAVEPQVGLAGADRHGHPEVLRVEVPEAKRRALRQGERRARRRRRDRERRQSQVRGLLHGRGQRPGRLGQVLLDERQQLSRAARGQPGRRLRAGDRRYRDADHGNRYDRARRYRPAAPGAEFEHADQPPSPLPIAAQ